MANDDEKTVGNQKVFVSFKQVLELQDRYTEFVGYWMEEKKKEPTSYIWVQRVSGMETAIRILNLPINCDSIKRRLKAI